MCTDTDGSAWNDNGKSGLVKDAYKFYRTDFFAGLGWMTTRAIWQEACVHVCASIEH